MINSTLEEIVRPYVAPNRAHRQYREKFLWLNGSCYLLHSGKEKLLALVREQIEANERGKPPGAYAVAVATAGGTTWLQGIHVSRADLHLMAEDFTGFLALAQRQTIISAHRVSVDFCFDLLADIAECEPTLFNEDVREKLNSRSLSPKKIANLFQRIGLPAAESPELQHQLHVLFVVRNLLEHHDGRVDDEYIRVTKSTQARVGDNIPIESQLAGQAIELVDHFVNALNKRAIRRWPKLADQNAETVETHSSGARDVQALLDENFSDAKSGKQPPPQKCPPKCQSLILCERASQDGITGKCSLLGIFNNYRFDRFPTHSDQCFIYAEVGDGIGEYAFHFEFHNKSLGKIVNRTHEIHRRFLDRTARGVILIEVPPLFIECEGDYEMVLLANALVLRRVAISASLNPK